MQQRALDRRTRGGDRRKTNRRNRAPPFSIIFLHFYFEPEKPLILEASFRTPSNKSYCTQITHSYYAPIYYITIRFKYRPSPIYCIIKAYSRCNIQSKSDIYGKNTYIDTRILLCEGLPNLPEICIDSRQEHSYLIDNEDPIRVPRSFRRASPIIWGANTNVA